METYIYTYCLRVRFLCGLFESELLEQALLEAVRKYNDMKKKRKNGLKLKSIIWGDVLI